jgi:hypothetical protein
LNDPLQLVDTDGEKPTPTDIVEAARKWKKVRRGQKPKFYRHKAFL